VNKSPNAALVVALGGNLGGNEAVCARFEQVIQSISESWGAPRVSSPYRTAPVGAVQDQPDFVNAVAAWWPEVAVSAREALSILQALEDLHGRVRSVVGGARTLDLDLLMHGETRCQEPGLIVPHPRMGERAFVLQPLQELFGGEFRWPESGYSVGELLATAALAAQGCERLPSPQC